MPATFYIKTYGCQMNERDSEMVAVLLQRHGYQPALREGQAEVVIVNTCSVRGKAEDKAMGKLRLLTAAKRKHPGRLVGAMGCMVQRMQTEIMQLVPGLDFAVGPRRLWTLPAVLDNARTRRNPVVDVQEEDCRQDADTHQAGNVTGFVNILFGCDRHCAYCVVPAVRGREWSRPAVEIVAEVRHMVQMGARDVTLLGQSVMAYGRQNPVWPAASRSPRGFTEPFVRLLEAVNDETGLVRLRFTSGHPSGCTAELIRAMAELPSVCEHLHLPLQSGADRILRMMNRGYTAADYRAGVGRVRAAVPRLALTTDLMVGFPTETEADFEQTRALMNEIRFDNAFIFKYNPRPGTPAAQWPDDVPDREKLRRNHCLLEDQHRSSLAIHQTLVGQNLEVLVEGPSRRNCRRWFGRSRTNQMVMFDTRAGLAAGRRVLVRIESASVATLLGQVRSIISE